MKHIKDNLILENKTTAIYKQSLSSIKTFDPKNTNDIKKIKNTAKIKDFIIEKRPSKHGLLLFKSKSYNLGVVTLTLIKKNNIACQYLGTETSLSETTKPTNIKKVLLKESKITKKTPKHKVDEKIEDYSSWISHYAFEIKKNLDILAHENRSVAAFINHNSTDPNIIADIRNDKIYYRAKRDINPGEQLLIDYGPDYDYPDELSYIPCTEGHLRPAEILCNNIKFYSLKPIKISEKQKKALQIKNDYVIASKDFNKASKNIKNLTDFKPNNNLESRLPVYEIVHYTKDTKNRYTVASKQKHLTELMLACANKSKEHIKYLIKSKKVDIFAKALDDLDALVVAIKSNETEEEFFDTSRFLLKTYTKRIERQEVLGSDKSTQTVLHMLIDKEWTKAIKFFTKSIFYQIVNKDGYDALLNAVAKGKTESIKELFQIPYVKKNLDELLLAEDELGSDYILKKAITDTPKKKLQEIKNIICETYKRKRNKKLKKLVNDLCSS